MAVATDFGDRRTLKRVAHLIGANDAERAHRALTPRETQVLHLVAAGLTHLEIAATLHLSVSTIRHTLTTMYDLLGARSRAALIASATSRGWLETDLQHPSASRHDQPT